MTIEEIKKAFQNKFGGESCWASDEVWNFFLPHLQPTEAERKVAQKIYDWLETEWYGRSELQTRIKLTYLSSRGDKGEICR